MYYVFINQFMRFTTKGDMFFNVDEYNNWQVLIDQEQRWGTKLSTPWEASAFAKLAVQTTQQAINKLSLSRDQTILFVTKNWILLSAEYYWVLNIIECCCHSNNFIEGLGVGNINSQSQINQVSTTLVSSRKWVKGEQGFEKEGITRDNETK